MSKAPIEPQEYMHGAKVVDIGDLRIARGKTRRPNSTCQHRSVVYDQQERRVYCSDCETDVDPFDAYMVLVEYWDGAVKRLQHERDELELAKQEAIISRAARAMDKAWRRRGMAPACPHCTEAILPEDVVGGIALVGKELAVAKRARSEK